MLQRVAAETRKDIDESGKHEACQCVAVCCRVLQSVAVCCSVLQCAAECCSVLQLRHARSSTNVLMKPMTHMHESCHTCMNQVKRMNV